MVGKKHESMELNGMEPQRSAQDTENQGFQLLGWLEEKPTLNRSTGHLHERTAFWDEANSSCHALKDAFDHRDLAESGGTYDV